MNIEKFDGKKRWMKTKMVVIGHLAKKLQKPQPTKEEKRAKQVEYVFRETN